MFRTIGLTACAFLLCFSAATSPVAARCLEGAVTAAYQHEGPYRGLFLYTVTLEFMLEKGLSNVTLDLEFGACVQYACAQTFLFPDPAGESAGEIANCPVTYSGEFNCSGNPSIDLDVPVVKWDVNAASGCEPGRTGIATLRFYSNLGPDPNRTVSLFLIKNGLEVCEGALTGDIPISPCAVPVQEMNWGTIKSIYQ